MVVAVVVVVVVAAAVMAAVMAAGEGFTLTQLAPRTNMDALLHCSVLVLRQM